MDSQWAIYQWLLRIHKDFKIEKNVLILRKNWFTISTYKDWTCLHQWQVTQATKLRDLTDT